MSSEVNRKTWEEWEKGVLANGEQALREELLLVDPRPRSEMNRMLLEALQRITPGYVITLLILGTLTLVGLFFAWGFQMRWGMGVAGIRRPVFWGFYIANFVFWIGISHSGTFVSAILRVFKAEYSRPITRGAEMMTTFSLMVAGLFPLIHLGRTWRFYWMIPYPNQRGLWPNFHSPLLWDMTAIFTYLTGSTLYLYLPLIPDFAMARDHMTGWRQKLYRILALGWRGTEEEWRHLMTAMKIFAFVIIPVMFSVHTIVSWDFAMTKKIGWHSSIFGPYFVVGAIFSGVSAVITMLLIARRSLKLYYFIRTEHLEALSVLILIFSFAWTYFFFNDFLVEWYGGDAVGHQLLTLQARGPVAPLWYAMLIFNILIPWATLWSKKIRRSATALFLITLGINIGMYLERVIIVTGFLQRNRMPFDWGTYNPSIVELSITVGSFSMFFFLYLLFTRFLPYVPVWEVHEGQLTHKIVRVGRAVVTAKTHLE